MNIVFAASFQGDDFKVIEEENGLFTAEHLADNAESLFCQAFTNKGTAVKALLSRINSWATDFETGAAE